MAFKMGGPGTGPLRAVAWPQKCIPPQRWEAILSDPGAGTLSCSAYLPGTESSSYKNVRPPLQGHG